MSNDRLVIVDKRVTQFLPEQLHKGLTYIDVELTGIRSFPSGIVLPNVQALKVHHNCSVNLTMFPYLKIFNGNVFG